MSTFSKSVAKTLFGNKDSHALAEAYALIEHKAGGMDVKLHSLIVKQKDAEVIARMIVARAISDPTVAHYWSRYLKRYVFGDKPIHVDATGHFVQGVVLGLFEAAVWFDQKWPRKSCFMDEFPEICVKVIVGKNELQQHADKLEVDSAYSGQLANAVKAYAKGTENNRGYRLAHTERIIKQVVEHVGSTEMIEEEIGILGNLVLDQLTYALFNQLVPYARARALRDWFTTFFEKELDLTKQDA